MLPKKLSDVSDLPSPPFNLAFQGRQRFGNYLNRRRLNGVGVEIGTHHGIFASQLLSNWDCKKFYCVDPWEDDLEGYPEKVLVNRRIDKQIATINLSKFNNVNILECTSEVAAGVVEDELDFVYIDGNHLEDYVRQDIELWLPKLKDGGILAGHDIEFHRRNNTSTPYRWRIPIEKVLTEKFDKIFLVFEAGLPWSWFVVKE